MSTSRSDDQVLAQSIVEQYVHFQSLVADNYAVGNTAGESGDDPINLDSYSTVPEDIQVEDKKDGQQLLSEMRERLNDLQHLLYADNSKSLLIVLQGMDGSGKDSTIRRVFGGVNPQGISVSSFKRPTDLELAHDYLWRVHSVTPKRGMIGIFNRSHYEDVMVPYIDGYIDETQLERRIKHINDFEQMLTDEGTTVIKIFLNLSKKEQKTRLEQRLATPLKRWKFEPADIEKRAQWEQYQQQYERVITGTSTRQCPWYIMPADSKWRRDLLIMSLVIGHLERLPLYYPKPKDGLDDIVIK